VATGGATGALNEVDKTTDLSSETFGGKLFVGGTASGS